MSSINKIEKKNKTNYVPTPEESLSRTRMYKHIHIMREIKEQTMPHFQTGPEGARSFNTYIDDSEMILNGFTPSRNDNGKEAWQSNLLDNITRAKLRAIAAGVGLKVPEMAFVATNIEGLRSPIRAELFKNITRQTYISGNPTLYTFQQIWHMMSHGVIFEYEGYRTGGAMQEVVESFDSVTGEVKTKKEYRKMDGEPFSVIINPSEFYWGTMFVNDIQDQPRIAWIQHFTRREIEMEFSKYPNYKFVKDRTEAGQFAPLQQKLYFQEWAERVRTRDDFEVVRYYSKADEGQEGKHGYEIWINGVPMLLSPLLWGDKEKIYPFAKQIAEPFANTNFFVGMSLPGILESYQDGKNTILNTLIDKLYRGINPLKLVGLQNRDLFDVESEITSQDNTIYVPDIEAVKFMEHPGINQGELAMLTIMERGIESSTVAPAQQGLESGVEKTARQAIIEDTRARELKGILFIYLEDLWLQKTRLRTEVVLSHYLKDKAAQETKKGKIITIKDYTFGDGGRGTLDIYVAKNKKDRLSIQEIESREQAMKEQGEAYKLVSMDADYINDWEIDFSILPESFHKQDMLSQQDELMGEIEQLATLFPEFFVANKDFYLKEVLEIHGRDLNSFNPPENIPATAEEQEEQEASPEDLKELDTALGEANI